MTLAHVPDTRPDAAILSTAVKRRLSDDPDDAFGLSGAVLAVSGPTGATTVVAEGVDKNGIPVTVDSFFPIASASKLAAGLLILQLVDEGVLDLEAPLARFLPDARASSNPDVTIRRLLSHTSGLPLEIAHDLSAEPGPVRYEPGLTWPGTLAAACLQTELATAPGEVLQYSNVAYGLLGLTVERISGEPFRQLVDRMVFRPLGIQAYLGDLPDRAPIAVSDVPAPYTDGPLEPFNSPTFLALGTPWGSVSTTAAGLLRLVRAYADDSPLLSPSTARMARTDQTGGVAGGFRTTDAFLGHSESRVAVWDPCPWGLAVEIQGGKQPHWALASMPRSVGQIGSSGCIGWYDPDSGVAWALLGTRSTESGWLLRHGGKFAKAALDATVKHGRAVSG